MKKINYLIIIAFALLITGCAQNKQAEPVVPKTEIRVKGYNSEILITPSVDNAISGVVTVTITQFPKNTKAVFFVIKGTGIAEEQVGPNLGIDSDASDGWSRLVDTTAYENGLYEISGLSMVDSDSNPIGAASAQVIIQN